MRPALAIALAFAAGLVGAAEPVPSTPRVIDLVAADSRGRPIETLTPADFSILERGVPQAIASARFVRDAARTVGIFLDEFHTSAEEADRVREPLARFLREELGPADRIAVFKPLDSLLAVKTTGHEEAAQAVDAFIGREGDYTPRTTFERNFIAGTPARIDDARNQIAFSALNALTTHLASHSDGRKTLLVVSSGIVRRARSRDGALPTLETVVRSANRGRVAIYAIEMGAPTGTTDDEAARAALRSLSTDTGGRAMPASADLTAGLKSILVDSSGYYALTLAPADDVLDGKFHPVAVSVARKGVLLRARPGYWALAPEAAVPHAALVPRSRVPELPRRTSRLIRPWFGMARGADGDTRVSFVWESAPRIPGDRAPVQVPARVAIKVSRADGTELFGGTVLPISAAGDVGDPQAVRATFDLPPGRLLVQLSIEDAASRVIDTDVRDLVVAGFREPLALGTAQVFRARSAREYRALAADPEATPVAARQFSRAERLMVRVPVYASPPPADVTARLVNRVGALLRELAVMPAPQPDSYQIDLPLAGFAAGEYAVEFIARTADGEAKDKVSIRVTP
jgi:VWFA-related protein